MPVDREKIYFAASKADPKWPLSSKAIDAAIEAYEAARHSSSQTAAEPDGVEVSEREELYTVLSALEAADWYINASKQQIEETGRGRGDALSQFHASSTNAITFIKNSIMFGTRAAPAAAPVAGDAPVVTPVEGEPLTETLRRAMYPLQPGLTGEEREELVRKMSNASFLYGKRGEDLLSRALAQIEKQFKLVRRS